MRSQILLVFFSLSSVCILQAQLVIDSIALTNVHLVMVEEERIDSNAILLLSNGKIRSILDSGDIIPDGYKTTDLTGAFVMPGMIDVHSHMASLESAEILDAAGRGHGD